MRLTLLIFLLSFTCKAQEDVLYHNLAGTAISVSTGLLTYKCTDKIGVSMLTGLTCGVVAGLAKEEIWDRKWKRGTPSSLDKLSTSWGSCVGSIVLVMVIGTRENILDKKWEKYNDKYNFKIDTNEVR